MTWSRAPEVRLQLQNYLRGLLMTSPPQLARQLLTLLRQHTQAADERHLKTLSGMVAALILVAKVSLSAWVPYLCSRAQQARSYQRRCERWLSNKRIDAASIYGPLPLGTTQGRAGTRIAIVL